MKNILCIGLIWIFNTANAQIPEEIKNTIEKYLENAETNADYTQVYDDLSAYFEKNINLNQASLTELVEFPLISQTQAIAIVDHRNTFGVLLNLNELQVLGFSPEQIRLIQPFVTVKKNASDQWQFLAENLRKGQAEFVNTIGTRYPIAGNDYIGNPLSHSIRFKYSLPSLYSFGFTADKDAGEKYWYGSGRRGPDYYSMHVSVQNIGIVKAAVLGDFLLNFGQGLVMGSGIGIGKSANVMNIKRGGPNVKPYRGINEFQFFRGAVVNLQWKKISWVLAKSVNSLDARVGSDSSLDQAGFSSVDMDGYHRDSSELANRGNTKRDMNGTWLQYLGNRGSFGLGTVNFHYNVPLTANSDLYRLYYPVGKNLTFHQIFQGYTFRQFHLFSEWAYLQQNNTHGINIGLLSSLGKGTDLAILYRNYSPGFISPFSTAFGNNSQNEKGLYVGMKLQFNRRLSLSQYIDIWQNPWLAFRNYNPAKNNELFWQLEYLPDKKSSIVLRYRNIQRQQNFSYEGPFKYGEDYSVNSFRMHITTPASKSIVLEMRAETAYFVQKENRYNSNLLFTEITANPKKLRGTTIVARYSLFNVPYYYNRLFAFENQLPYSFGTVAFYGKGYSYYVLLNTKLSRYLKMGLRYNFTRSIAPGETKPADRQGIFAQLYFKM